MAMIDGHEAQLTYNGRNVAWVIFKPAVVFKPPCIWAGAPTECIACGYRQSRE